MDNALFENVDHYIRRLMIPSDEQMDAIALSCEKAGLPMHSISANQGRFLQMMAILCQSKKILEIGALGGYSTAWLARGLEKGGRVISLESNPGHAEVARENMKNAGLEPSVEIRTGRALELLPELEKENAGPFDMIFIDADKPPYTEYLEWAVRLSRPGTLIVADNVIREGKVLDDLSADEAVKGVQRFNRALGSHKKLTATILPMVGIKEFDGMALAVVNP